MKKTLLPSIIMALLLLFSTSKANNLEYVSGIPATVNDYKIVGNIMYCAVNNGIMIMDYTDAAAPQMLSYLQMEDAAGQIEIQGEYAYVMARTAGMRIINISNPSEPFETGSFRLGNSAQGWGIAVQANFAYLAYGMDGFRIVDISNPSSPAETGAFFLPESDIFSRVVVKENVAYTTVGNIVYALNVQNPQSPVLLGQKSILGGITDMALRQNFLICVSNFNDFSSSFYGLIVLDVTNPASINQVGNYDTDVYSYKLGLSGNLCYIGNGTAGVAVLNVDALGLVTYIGNVGGFTSPVRLVRVSDGKAFVSGEKIGIQSFMVDTPASFTHLSSFSTLHDCRDIQIRENVAYIANGRDGLVTVDISDPIHPVIIGWSPNSGNGLGIALNNDYAYIADGSAGVMEYNIVNPHLPVLTGSVMTDNWAQDIVIRNNIGYVAVDVLGLQLLNLSIPGLPSSTGSAFDLSGTSYGIALKDNLALLASGGAGLHLVDISMPAQPALVSTYNTPGSAYDVFSKDNKVYIADSQGGLVVVDISDIHMPQGIGQSFIPGDARQVIVEGNSAFVADWSHGIRVLSINDPANMIQTHNYKLSGTAHNMALHGEFIYIASGSAGLTILRNPLSTGKNELKKQAGLSMVVSPNPIQESFTINLNSTKPLDATLRLYDVTGRELGIVFSGTIPAGESLINSCSANPLICNIKSGIYLLKLDSASESISLKLVKP